MKIASFTVRRPIMTTMFTLIVVTFGLVSLMRLPIDLLPELTYPTLSISTTYGSASPEEMETLITEYIEEAVAATPGVKEITSTSGEGNSSVRVTFSWGTNLDVASNELRDRIDRVLRQLPENVDRPQLRKFDVAAFPIVILGVYGEMDPIALRQFIDDQIMYRIERVPGVAAADVWGGLEREIQVNLDVEKIKALSIPLDTILQRLRESNLNTPAGSIESGNFDVTIRTPGEYQSLDEIADTVVMVRDGAPITLGQIARIDDTHARETRIIRINDKPGVRLAVRKQTGTNTVEIADAVLAEVAQLSADFPQLEIVPVIDTSLYIRRSIDNVKRAVLLGGILAVVVLFVFLRNWRSTLVISTAIPISIIASFALVYFGGFTLNLMTLGGLALGVGMMVDNAIVVLENIFRLKENGYPPDEAAIEGTNEVTPAIIASTATTLVIFLPLLFVEGVSGVMFGQLAYVVGFSLICSLVVAVTLVPVLASKFLAAGTNKARFPLMVALEKGFHGMETVYRDVLELALRWRFVTVLLVVAVVGSSFLLLPRIGGEFLPPADEGEVRVDVEMAVGTRLAVIDAQTRLAEEIVRNEVPEAIHRVVSVGASPWRASGGSTGSIQIALPPIGQRQRSSQQIANDLRDALTGIPGVEIRTRVSQGLRVLRMGGGDESVSIEIYGYELSVLDELAQRVQEAVTPLDGITDVRISREAGVPQEIITFDRQRAADLGLTVSRVASALETAISGSSAGYFRELGREHRILVKLADSEQLSLEEILDLTVTNDRGEPVVLRNLVNVEPRRGPQVVERKNQERVAVVSANYEGRDLEALMGDIQNALRDIPRPDQYTMLLAGDFEEQQQARRDLLLALLMSLILVYMVLASLYESYRDPLVVMFSVPLAATGVLVMLFLTDTTFNMQSFIGCIMLGGIVVNNAILLVDQAARLQREEGWRTHPAVLEAGRRRLRPILMTSLTTMLGLLPLALGLGEGAEQQAPLARAVIGGMLSSTLITLLFIPVVYTFANPEPKTSEAEDAQTSLGDATPTKT